MDTFTCGDKAPATRQATGASAQSSDDVALLYCLRHTCRLVMDSPQCCASARLPS